MKNQKLSLLAVVSACLLALFGCAPSGDGDSSEEKSLTGPIADVQGTWITGCLPNDGTYRSGTVTISGTSASQVEIVYSDSACTTELSKVSESFVFTIGDSIGFSDSSTGHKFTYSEGFIEMTSLNDLMTDLLNNENTCGITWATNVAYNLNGKTCGTFTYPVKNTTMFNVYKLVGNNLYFGSASSTSYPTTVSSPAFVKQ